MSRRALVITNPGEPGAENYCNGVNRDRESYRAFLDSPIGGWWYSSEIQILDRPRVADVKIAVEGLKGVDYSVVIFSGHGCYSKARDETILELRDGQEIDASELIVDGRKQTLIVDCCRMFTAEDLRESLVFKAQRALPELHGPMCRMAYDQAIQVCATGTVVMYACAPGEYAYDTAQGGVYSYSLIRGAHEWAEYVNCDTRFGSEKFSVAAAHEAAAARVARRRGQPQSPGIEKARSGPYFPFAVVA